LMKRITWWPQLVLAITFNAGALVGFMLLAPLDAYALPWVVYAACACWTLGYDTLYAVQDSEDDAQVGIKSTARLLGARVPPFVLGCYLLCVGLLSVACVLAGAHGVAFAGLAAFGLHLVWQWARARTAPPSAHGALFSSNASAGGLFFLGLCAEKLL
jgi:4-hydroxybenzoate polyprenyltransferase